MGISSGSQSLTAKQLFSFIRNVEPPEAGDLREPVTFYHSHRVPLLNPDGSVTDDMKAEVTPYHNAWAFVWQAEGAYLDGQNTQNVTSTVFVVRNFDGFLPEIRDGVVYQGSIFMVRGVRNLQKDRDKKFLLVICEQEGRYAEEPRDNTLTPEDALNEYAGQDPGNPLWR